MHHQFDPGMLYVVEAKGRSMKPEKVVDIWALALLGFGLGVFILILGLTGLGDGIIRSFLEK